MLLAIPVVDLRAGRCVHSHAEKSGRVLIDQNPSDIFSELIEQGVSHVQLVDVDAIRNRQPEHLPLVSQLKHDFPQLKLQVSAGVTCPEDIQIWLDAGADWVTLGGRMLRQKDNLEMTLIEFGQKVIIGFDVKASLWAQGYCPVPDMNFFEWTEVLRQEGVYALMFTEVPETGHVNGHSLLSASKLAKEIQLPVIAHGGIISRKDLVTLTEPKVNPLLGVTLGKSMFDSDFTYPEAISLLCH